MTDPADLEYLNSLYAASEDPWHRRSGWYSERKRDVMLSSLPAARYSRGFEPGCSVGDLTVALARRCDSLLAADYHRTAVDAATERTRHLSGVRVERRLLPQEWPEQERFDLLVLSEIGYYLTVSAWAELSERAAASLTEDATVMACHWRHDFNERTLETETIHGMLDSVLGLPKHSTFVDQDFVLDVWVTNPSSVAEREGLTSSGRPY